MGGGRSLADERGRRLRFQDAHAARGTQRELATTCPAPARVYLLTDVLTDWLVRLEREDSLPRIVVARLASSEEHGSRSEEATRSAGRRLEAHDRLRFPTIEDDPDERGGDST